jgi:predicted RNase H-like nuclease (RuvC/YqgF family)
MKWLWKTKPDPAIAVPLASIKDRLIAMLRDCIKADSMTISKLRQQLTEQSDMKEELDQHNAQLKIAILEVEKAIAKYHTDNTIHKGDSVICIDSDGTDDELETGKAYRVSQVCKRDFLLSGYPHSWHQSRFRLHAKAKPIVSEGDVVREVGGDKPMIVTNVDSDCVECGRYGCFDPSKLIVVRLNS